MEKFELEEILKALNLFSTNINTRFDSLENKVNSLENKVNSLDNKVETLDQQMNERLDRLEKKFDGFRVELVETQETLDYLSSKNLQHEKKLRTITSNEA